MFVIFWPLLTHFDYSYHLVYIRYILGLFSAPEQILCSATQHSVTRHFTENSFLRLPVVRVDVSYLLLKLQTGNTHTHIHTFIQVYIYTHTHTHTTIHCLLNMVIDKIQICNYLWRWFFCNFLLTIPLPSSFVPPSLSISLPPPSLPSFIPPSYPPTLPLLPDRVRWRWLLRVSTNNSWPCSVAQRGRRGRMS